MLIYPVCSAFLKGKHLAILICPWFVYRWLAVTGRDIKEGLERGRDVKYA